VLWLTLPTLAAPLRLVLSPGATPDVLPVARAGRVDVIVRGNREELRPQVRDRRFDDVVRTRVVDLGGEQVLSAWVAEDRTLAVARDGDAWLFAAVPWTPPEPGGPGRVVALELRQGVDTSGIPGALSLEPALPVWAEAEPWRASWADVDALRQEMFGTEHPPTPAQRYRLGALLRDLGQAREAAYYFGQAAVGAAEGGVVLLQRAGALARARQFGQAAVVAREAERAGAEPAFVLELVGIAALAGAGPPPAALGRELAQAAMTPQASLVAGALLLRAGLPGEATAPLAAAAPHLHGDLAARAWLLLADAELAAGRLSDAESALAQVEPGQFTDGAGLLRVRSELASLLGRTPDRWLDGVPRLQSLARGQGESALDALFLLGQVYAALGEERAAIESWSELVRRDPQAVAGVAGDRLAEAWEVRTRMLVERGGVFDAVTLHAAAWRPGLGARIADPGLLRAVGVGYRDAGLARRALDCLREVAAIESDRGLDPRDTGLEVGETYVAMGAWPQVEETAAWLARLGAVGDAAALSARAAGASGRPSEARSGWTRAAREGRWAVEARLHLAMLDAAAGDCADARPVLEAALGEPRPEVADALARCGGSKLLAAGAALDEGSVRAGAWEALSAGASGGLLAESLVATPDVWGRLAAEEATHAGLRARLAARR
jgi:tetratricopeptide (TPR) repeat protein